MGMRDMMLTTGCHQSCKVGKRVQFTGYPSTTHNTLPFYSPKCPGPQVVCGQLVLGGGRGWDMAQTGCAELRDGRQGWGLSGAPASWGDSHEVHRARGTAVLLL